MTTAREKLYQEIVALAGAAAGPAAEAEVRKVMTRYRVQTKPGVHIPDGATARDALGDRLLALWREQPEGLHDKVGATIDEFRMQVKQKAAQPKASVPSASTSAAPKAKPAQKPAAKRPAPLPAAGNGASSAPKPPPSPPSEPRSRRMVSEPVAGGPRRRGKTRSECPKCHSMGVVLARSYAGDEYYSCIYCGWQAYKPADESDPAASLAARLLGQGAPEKG